MQTDDMAAIFGASRTAFAEVAPQVWDPLGEASVRRVGLTAGQRVLDACCGIGSSAIPAARQVGADGVVDAVDIATELLAEGRQRAELAGLPNVRFTAADVTTWTGPDAGYDAVLCVYGVFLLPDMDRGTARLRDLLAPAGKLAVTVWASGALEDYARALHETTSRFREPRSAPGKQPIERINTPALLRGWLGELGLSAIEVREIPLRVPLTDELAWGLVLGSGFRGMLGGFDEDTVRGVREGFLGTLAERGITHLNADSLVGIGHRRPLGQPDPPERA